MTVAGSVEPTSGAFVEGEHRLPVRVYYEDTDFSGVVYHANYLRFFERGRTDALRCMGVHHTELLEDQAVFVVRRMEVEYIRPARVDDALIVRTRFVSLRGARMVIDQILDRDGVVIAAAKVEAALIGLDGRPRRFRGPILQRLTAFLPGPTP
jgi:acyl-CoA thioester hydrolase